MLTVGIAVHNEEKCIKKAITLWQKEPVDEILVISSGSTDSTDTIIRALREKDSRIRLISEREKKGKPAAINKILDLAKGDKIIMTDGDVYVEPGAANLLEAHFTENKIGLVAGHPVPLDPKGVSGCWMRISCDILHSKRSKNIELDVTGNLYAIRKGIVEKIPENTTLDDVYVALEVKKKGYDIVYEPEAIVRVKGVTTIGDFMSQKTRTRVGWRQIQESEKAGTSRTPAGDLLYIPKLVKYIMTPSGIIAVPSYLMLSAATWLLAWWKWKTEKNYLKLWKTAKSTK